MKKMGSKDYLEEYINPPDFMEFQQRKIEEDRLKKRAFPEEPDKDILLFLIENAPLENWQREILALIREENYYFAPPRANEDHDGAGAARFRVDRLCRSSFRYGCYPVFSRHSLTS